MSDNQSSQSAFIETIPKQFSSGDIKKLFRTMKDGLFAHEEVISELIAKYQDWFENSSAGSKLGEEKIRKKLFGNDDAKLQYLLDGNVCIPGYFISSIIDQKLRQTIPFSQASLLDTTNYLHPRDPKLVTLTGVKTIIDKHKGFIISLNIKNISYKLDYSTVTNFVQVARKTPRLIEKFPELLTSLRECIPSLKYALESARLVKENQRLLVPRELYKKNVKLIVADSIVFALENDTNIIACYGLNIKNIKKLIDSEFESVKCTGISEINASRKKPWQLGITKIKGQSYIIHKNLLCDVATRVNRSPTLKKKFSGKYSLDNVLKELLEMLNNSNLIHGSPKDTKAPKKNETVRFFKFKTWRFSITGKNVIASAEEILGKVHNNKNPRKKNRNNELNT